MENTIYAQKTYTVKEVSEILRVSENLAERLIRENTIRSIKVGREYRVTGKALLEYLELDPVQSPRRSLLLKQLNIAIEGLMHEMKLHDDQDLGVFLNQAINIYADETTLARILEDVNSHRDALKEKRRK